MLKQAMEWCALGRRNVDMVVCSQGGQVRTRVWAYDFDVMHGIFLDLDNPHWPSTEELKEMRVADLKRQIEEVAA